MCPSLEHIEWLLCSFTPVPACFARNGGRVASFKLASHYLRRLVQSHVHVRCPTPVITKHAQVTELSETTRGTGGFGSTGVAREAMSDMTSVPNGYKKLKTSKVIAPHSSIARVTNPLDTEWTGCPSRHAYSRGCSSDSLFCHPCIVVLLKHSTSAECGQVRGTSFCDSTCPGCMYNCREPR